MNWTLTYHGIQVITAIVFIFGAGVMLERRSYIISLLMLIAGVLILLAEATAFVAFIGPLIRL